MSVGQPQQVVKYTYDQQIIKPPESNTTEGRITQHVVIDSRGRDCSKYPDPNNYVVELKGVLDKVVGLSMTRYAIPKTGYVVNLGNNEIHFRETDDGDILTGYLRLGNYEIDDFLTEIGIAMTFVSVTGTVYSASVTERNRWIMISFIPGDDFERLSMITGCIKNKKHPLTHARPDYPSIPSIVPLPFNSCQSSAAKCSGTFTPQEIDPLTQEIVDMPKTARKLMGFKKGVYCSGSVSEIAPVTVSDRAVDDALVTFTTTGGNIDENFWLEDGGGDAVEFVYTAFRVENATGEVECLPLGSTSLKMTTLSVGEDGKGEIKAYLNGGGVSGGTGLIHQTSSQYVIVPTDHSGITRTYAAGRATYVDADNIFVANTTDISNALYGLINDGTITNGDRLGLAYLSTEGEVVITTKEITVYDSVSDPAVIGISSGVDLPNIATGSEIMIVYYENGDDDDYYQLMLTGGIESIEGGTLYSSPIATGATTGDKVNISYWDTTKCKIVCEERVVLNALDDDGAVPPYTIVFSGSIPSNVTKIVWNSLNNVTLGCFDTCASGGGTTLNVVSGDCPYNLLGVDYLLLKLNEEVGSDGKFEGSSDVALGTFDVALMESVSWKRAFHNLGDQYASGARKLYNPPRDKLSKVRVAFYTPDGELYDFNCQDHMFCLEIDLLNQPNHYKVTPM